MDISPKFKITLTREEILLITKLGGFPIFPGIEKEHLGELTPEQKAIGLIYAEHSLCARGLARITSTGKLEVAQEILKVVWLCGNSPSAISIMTVNGKTAYRSLLYVNGKETVLHRPNSSQHELEIFETFEEAVTFFTPMLNWPSSKPKVNIVATVSENFLLSFNKAIGQNQQSRVYNDLIDENVTKKVTQGFSNFISNDFTYTFIQIAKHKKDNTILLRDITVLNNDVELWGIIKRSLAKPKGARVFVLGTMSKDGILDLISQELKAEK